MTRGTGFTLAVSLVSACVSVMALPSSVSDLPVGQSLPQPLRRGEGPRAKVERTRPPEVSREVYLMGTRATLTTWDIDRARAVARLEALLETLEATEARLSTWRSDSEVSALNAGAGSETVAVSSPLCDAFREIDRWHTETGGAFDPAIGALTSAWDIHGPGRVPDRPSINDALRHSGWKLTGFDPALCTMSMAAGVMLDVGGFGKGEALDLARSNVPAQPAGWLIDLGGQLALAGAVPSSEAVQFDIAHPLDRKKPFLTCTLTNGSVSTSAGSERDLRVGTTRVGHIIDPRTGVPAKFRGSVTVWHERALAADILSTALYVMGPRDGLHWADTHDVAVVFLIPSAGRVLMDASRRWNDQRACATTSP